MKQKYLIYGSTGGIGSALCQRLNQLGCELHLVARNPDRLNAQAAALNAGFTAGDVLDPALFARAAENAGGVTGLVYCVGTINLKPFGRLAQEDYLNDFRINAIGAAHAVQASLPALKKAPGGGSVVLFSSVAAERGFSFHASMGMAKSAVSGLTRSLAAELAPLIRVNAIAPSLTKTPLAEGILANDKTEATITALHPLKRLGTPDDIAAAAAFLLSSDSSWVTGQVIGVDGGRSTL